MVCWTCLPTLFCRTARCHEGEASVGTTGLVGRGLPGPRRYVHAAVAGRSSSGRAASQTPICALDPVLDAVRVATRSAGCEGYADTDPWLPHVSVAYSNRSGPVTPIIAALGR